MRFMYFIKNMARYNLIKDLKKQIDKLEKEADLGHTRSSEAIKERNLALEDLAKEKAKFAAYKKKIKEAK